ncbi:uncharacterized protein M421DRAFT_320097 [Didymella exigua CBS 183.55]|uniref:Uncharacterized protein n=1 Tax=Didymella exigua CBS 183.55 TaxID=1150837 RepID=A0A6A5RZS3_9PLEO|nr:uncharacterized protein M421DRAFT_320097 [Didymella exigua CBS 183.55]KAF1931756.1 hypothetical protein M421DRAFT_320097 [Didymella exigua CBS 183.55]
MHIHHDKLSTTLTSGLTQWYGYAKPSEVRWLGNPSACSRSRGLRRNYCSALNDASANKANAPDTLVRQAAKPSSPSLWEKCMRAQRAICTAGPWRTFAVPETRARNSAVNCSTFTVDSVPSIWVIAALALPSKRDFSGRTSITLRSPLLFIGKYCLLAA